MMCSVNLTFQRASHFLKDPSLLHEPSTRNPRQTSCNSAYQEASHRAVALCWEFGLRTATDRSSDRVRGGGAGQTAKRLRGGGSAGGSPYLYEDAVASIAPCSFVVDFRTIAAPPRCVPLVHSLRSSLQRETAEWKDCSEMRRGVRSQSLYDTTCVN